MELSITRRESTGALPNQYNESERITLNSQAKQFLYAYSSVAFLTPTFRDVNKKFNKRYYLNLVLIDKENPRYFKQQEITIFRILEN
ncbi:hypothetical protein H2248_012119 [Termitomyces sp. 'cryptogamus']|nr:hypothetical protein H2248_012119 [Termitomyces sp. 'cryptogamus']